MNMEGTECWYRYSNTMKRLFFQAHCKHANSYKLKTKVGVA